MSVQFKFPQDIPLTKPPLKEAWLEIRWRADEHSASQFTFALGSFRNLIKEEFDEAISLDESGIPAEIFPHIARYRFKNSKQDYPLIQLGPTVATVNFTHPYSWEVFKQKAQYLRNNLNTAFEEELDMEHFALRYRNFLDFDPQNNNLLQYLNSHLNIQIELPNPVPGDVAHLTWPTGVNHLYEYELKKPTGKGKINFATAKKNSTDEPMIMFQLEVVSSGAITEYWASEESFSNWLEDAHNVIHEWFFSFIEGELRKSYQ